MCEAIFADIASVQPLHVLSLRYFTLIGADPKMRTGLQLRQPTHALGSMILAHDQGAPFLITGTDYPTRDGRGCGTKSTSGTWPRPIWPPWAELLGWAPWYDLHDGIRHSLQWAAARDVASCRAAAPPRRRNQARSCDPSYRAKCTPWPCMAKIANFTA